NRVTILREIALAVWADREVELETRQDRRGQIGGKVPVQEVGEFAAGHRDTAPSANSRRSRVERAWRARCSPTLTAVGVASSIVATTSVESSSMSRSIST